VAFGRVVAFVARPEIYLALIVGRDEIENGDAFVVGVAVDVEAGEIEFFVLAALVWFFKEPGIDADAGERLVFVIDDADGDGACAVEDKLDGLGVIVREFVGVALRLVFAAEEEVVEADTALHGDDGLNGEVGWEMEDRAAVGVGFCVGELFVVGLDDDGRITDGIFISIDDCALELAGWLKFQFERLVRGCSFDFVGESSGG
jgi:hypothetical protein